MPLNPRVRDNNVFGTVEDNPLSINSTSLNSAGLANLSTVATKHAVITLDPLRQFGPPEIVIVTTHTASSALVTMTRGAYNTVAREHPQGTLWVHAPITEDFISIRTSLDRPLDPYEGQFIFEADTNKLVGYGGVDWAPRDAGGKLALASASASQTAIVDADVTNLSATATIGTGRLIKITWYEPNAFEELTTGANYDLKIMEGATILNASVFDAAGGNDGGPRGFTGLHVFSPSAGVHTYKARITRSTGAGQLTLSRNANTIAFLLVEDIGAA